MRDGFFVLILIFPLSSGCGKDQDTTWMGWAVRPALRSDTMPPMAQVNEVVALSISEYEKDLGPLYSDVAKKINEVRVTNAAFYCGSVLAEGCTDMTLITIAWPPDECFLHSFALPHELLHVALGVAKGDRDGAHADPMWGDAYQRVVTKMRALGQAECQ